MTKITQPLCRVCFKRVLARGGKRYDSLDPPVEHKCDTNKAGVAEALKVWAGKNE